METLEQDLARPPIGEEQDLARPLKIAAKGRAETCSEGQEQEMSGPINNNIGKYLSGLDIGRAKFVSDVPWLNLSDDERAAREAGALAYLHSLTNLIPADAARVSNTMTRRFGVPQACGLRMFWRSVSGESHAA